jgi:hypothetical protein
MGGFGSGANNGLGPLDATNPANMLNPMSPLNVTDGGTSAQVWQATPDVIRVDGGLLLLTLVAVVVMVAAAAGIGVLIGKIEAHRYS